MKYCLPGDMWNQVIVPRDGATTTVGAHIAEMLYKLPSVPDLLLEKEYWHLICEFADRCGALLERKTVPLLTGESPSAIDRCIQLEGDNAFQLGNFQRLVGASLNGARVGLGQISVDYAEHLDGALSVTFDGTLMPDDNTTYIAVVEASVVPELGTPPVSRVLPRWFLKRYSNLLIHGTLANVLSMENESWTDMGLAKMNATAFANDLKTEVRGLLPAGMRKDALVGLETAIVRRQLTTTGTTTQTVE